MPKVPGMIKGAGVTFKELTKTMFPNKGIKKLIPSPSKGAQTVQYPHEKEAPPTRARGVIALLEENCTVC
ncbi:MAG: NADH-quinone oxidoreductase subunit, partial [Acidimicrobiaceae bacterium]